MYRDRGPNSSVWRSIALAAIAAGACLGAPADPSGDQVTGESTDPPAYDRKLYKHWVDADRDCLNTREEVLAAESLRPVEFDDKGCKVGKGSWYDPFTGERLTDPSALDVDHLVPLAEAHISGAHAWTPERKEAYANDLDHAETLIAVNAGVNRSKGSSDPAEWLPPNQSYRCEYARNWVIVKATWGLASDEEEDLAIQRVLQSCGRGAPTELSDASESSLPDSDDEAAADEQSEPAGAAAEPPADAGRPVAARPEPGAEESKPKADAGACKDIDTAESAALQAVVGIGPAKARAILEDRASRGPFGSLDNLTRVSGVGPATLRNFEAAGFCVDESASEPPGPAAARPEPTQSPASASARQRASNCTDINASGSSTLHRVSGIGAARAQAIIEYRDRNGPFQTLEHITRVSGVGPSTLANFREAGFCVAGRPPAGAPDPPSSASATAPAPPVPARAGGSRNCTDINEASATALQSVSGIGRAKALAIVEYRDRNGPFRRLDQLTRVSGVGPATLRNFRAAGYCAQ